MSIDYESLSGEGKEDKARELVAYSERYGRTAELVARCKALRLHIDWQNVYQNTLIGNSTDKPGVRSKRDKSIPRVRRKNVKDLPDEEVTQDANEASATSRIVSTIAHVTARPLDIWLWESYGKTLVERLGKRFTGSAREEVFKQWDRFDWNGASERYRTELRRQYGTMRILGMADPIPLSDIYTDVHILDKPSAWRRYNIQELKSKSLVENNESTNDVRQKGLNVVKQKTRLYILGKPGAGKTTLLKYLAIQSVEGHLSGIPIFISLKSWVDSKINLKDYILSQFETCSFPNVNEFVEYVLGEGYALILLDGLDEVNQEQNARINTIQTIREFTKQYTKSRCIITCRTAASDYQFENFSYCELADFTHKQAISFVDKWFNQDKKKHDQFLLDFEKLENKNIRELSRTPLLLTLLCINYDETMNFPPHRAEIYEEALDSLMKKMGFFTKY